MAHKLVTFYLADGISTSDHSNDCDVKEHLEDYLRDGWKIEEFTTLDGSGGSRSEYSGGWVVVLLSHSY